MHQDIQLPYIPHGRIIQYVEASNPFMQLARAQCYSLDKIMPGGAVVVKGDLVLGVGANGSDYHEEVGC